MATWNQQLVDRYTALTTPKAPASVTPQPTTAAQLRQIAATPSRTTTIPNYNNIENVRAGATTTRTSTPAPANTVRSGNEIHEGVQRTTSGGGSTSSGGSSSGGGSRSYSSGGGGGYSSGGGGGGSSPGFPAPTMGEPLTGFAARYLPAAIQDVLDNPDMIARDVLSMLGIESDQLGNVLSGQLGHYVRQILPLLYGQNPIGSVPTAGKMVNRAAEYAQGLTQPGGEVFNPMPLLQKILSEAGKTSTGSQTILSNLFTGQTAADQASTMASLVNTLANYAPNAMMAQALRNWSQRQSQEFLRQSSQVSNPYKQQIGTFLTSGPNANIFGGL